MLFFLCVGTIMDLSRPFPRPTASQALTQLAKYAAEVERQAMVEDGPCDILDVYGTSAWLANFEAEIASLFGKESGLFYTTGIAAQNSALAVHAELPSRERGRPPPVFMMHDTSHLQRYEESAYKELLGVNALLVGASERVLTAADLATDLERLASVGQGPCMIVVELPMRELGGVTPSWEQLVEMRRLADQFDVPLHLDGARLWEIGPFYEASAGKKLADVAALFDSVYLSFYKGLGALTGAMLLGNSRFIAAAEIWRRRQGANPYTVFPYALSSYTSYHAHSHTFASRWEKLKHLVPLLRLAAEAHGGALRTIPEEPLSCMAHVCIGAGTEVGMEAMNEVRDAIEEEHGVRVFGRLLGPAPGSTGTEFHFELSLGPAHVDMDDAVFVDAWDLFFKSLARRKK